MRVALLTPAYDRLPSTVAAALLSTFDLWGNFLSSKTSQVREGLNITGTGSRVGRWRSGSNRAGALDPGSPLPPGLSHSRYCVCRVLLSSEVSGMAREVKPWEWSLPVIGLIHSSGIHSSVCQASWVLCRALGYS